MDFMKAAILLAAFAVGAPLVAFVLKGRRKLQAAAFGVMCFLTISGLFSAAEWGLTLHDMPEYRGHARGFHVYFNVILRRGPAFGRVSRGAPKIPLVPAPASGFT